MIFENNTVADPETLERVLKTWHISRCIQWPSFCDWILYCNRLTIEERKNAIENLTIANRSSHFYNDRVVFYLNCTFRYFWEMGGEQESWNINHHVRPRPSLLWLRFTRPDRGGGQFSFNLYTCFSTPPHWIIRVFFLIWKFMPSLNKKIGNKSNRYNKLEIASFSKLT